MARFLPRLFGGSPAYEVKAPGGDTAANGRASQGRGYAYANQPYTAPGADIDRLVRDGYEKVIWAFKAIDAIADKMSSWPIKVMEGQEPDWKQVDDPILPLLNAYSNQIERSAKYFRYRLVSQLLLSKRGVFVEVILDRAGRPKALNLLPPGMTAPIPGAGVDGGHVAKFRVDTPGMLQPHIDLDPYVPGKGGVVWIRKPHPTDPFSGLTPLEAAGISLDLDFYARLYNRNFLLNDGRAGQLVAVKGGLSPEDAMELKARFSPGMGGAGRTTVIEADSVSVNDTAISPRDAQYAELRAITKEDLLIALGTPESVIGNASGRTFDNADAEKENWLDVTVLPLSSVVESGVDVLTRDGWEDERSVVHDVSGEPVLRRRAEFALDKARADHAANRITIDEFRRIASSNGLELDELKRPASRVLWLPSGMMPVGPEADETAAAAMLSQQATPAPPDPMAAMGGGLEGFDAELDALDPAALTAALGEVDPSDDPGQVELDEAKGFALEEKAFNPNQPRYPVGHPQGGAFMDAGDTALWLAGKPLKGGFSSASVANPNPGSTASPVTALGASGAARFTQHPSPSVRAAAAVISHPAGYPYARVLGAPPAVPVKPPVSGRPGPKPTKVVSLRKGDVVKHPSLPGDWSVADAKRSRVTGAVDLTLVDADGKVQTLTISGQAQLGAVARTPHPTVVAQAKRDVAAAARALTGQPAAPTPAAAPAAPAVPAAAPAPAAVPAPAPAGPQHAHPVGTSLLAANGASMVITATGADYYGANGNGHPSQITHGVVNAQLRNGSWSVTPAYVSPVTPPPTPTPPAPVAAAAAGKPINVPAPAAGWDVYVHPSGKHIYVSPSGFLEVWKPDGKRGTSSATATKLQQGHGQWVRVGAPLTNTSQHPNAKPVAAPVAAPPVAAPSPPVVAAAPPVTAAAPAALGSPTAARVIAAGVPSTVVTTGWRKDASWKGSGSNAAAALIDPTTGNSHYVKFQDDEHADNEVTAALLYQAAGVQTPTVKRAIIQPGVGATQTGIASEGVKVTEDLSRRMQRDPAYRDKVLQGFAVHAWLGNWDALENDNTSTAPNGDPITIDVGGSLAFRARGTARRLGDTVGELQTMRNQTAGGAARAAFAQLTPDHTDARFVAGVEAIAAISPTQIQQIVDAGMPSFSARKRADLVAQLVKRRAHMAQEARVTLPENRAAAAPAPVAAPAAAPAAPTPPPAPAAPAAPAPAAGVPQPGPAVAAAWKAGGPNDNVLPGMAVNGDDVLATYDGDLVVIERNGVDATFYPAGPGATAPFPMTLGDVANLANTQRQKGQALRRLRTGTGFQSTLRVPTPAPTPAPAPGLAGIIGALGNGPGTPVAPNAQRVVQSDATGWTVGDTVRSGMLLPPPGSVLTGPTGATIVIGSSGGDATWTAPGSNTPTPAQLSYARLQQHMQAAEGRNQGYTLQSLPTAAAPTPAPVVAGPVAQPNVPAAVLAKLGTPPAGMTVHGYAQSVLTPPASYPYPVVAGAPTANPLPRAKAIKLASLRKGDVIDIGGSPHTIVSTAGGSVQVMAGNGATVTVPPSMYVSGSLISVARTPHPQVVAAARRVLQAPVPAGAAPSPAPAAAVGGPNVPAPAPGAPGPVVASSAQGWSAGDRVTQGFMLPPAGSVMTDSQGGTFTVGSSGGDGTYVGQGGTVQWTYADIQFGLSRTTWTVQSLPGQAPAGPVVRTTPSHLAGPSALAAARSLGAASPNGYAPIPGQTYADYRTGDTLTVHSDGSATLDAPGGGGIVALTASGVDNELAPGTAFRPIGPQPRTPTLNIAVGRHSNTHGDVVDVNPDGTGKLTMANGSVTPLTDAAVDQLLNQPPAGVQPAMIFGYEGPSPHHSRASNAASVAATPPPVASNPLVGQPMPAGGWGPAGQIQPGAVFTNAAGDTLSVGPRGGGKLVAGGVTRNMSAAALASNLNRRRSTWTLTTAAPQTLVAPAPAAPAAPAATPGAPQAVPFVSAVGQPASTFIPKLQDKQVFRNTKSGNTLTISGAGSVLTIGARGKGTAGSKSAAMTARTLAAQGWVADSGPDIDAPGRDHARQVRMAARQAGLPPAGTPLQGIPPAGATYPTAAAGVAQPTAARDVARGQTVRVGGEDYVVTEVNVGVGAAGVELWGYRPGLDDPNTLTQEAPGSKVWRQGVKLPLTRTAPAGQNQQVDVIGPVPQLATNVPGGATARNYDAALGAATTTPVVGAGVPGLSAFAVNSQLVNADTLQAGDAILVNGQESRGLFVVTAVKLDHKNRQAVYGYAATEADAADAAAAGTGDRTETKLFLTNPGNAMRQARVQVNGATPALPEVPRPRPPVLAGGDIERNDISDATSQAQIKAIFSGRGAPIALPNSSSAGDRQMAQLMELRGYNAAPDVVTEDEMDAYVADGEIEMYRGWTHDARVGDVVEEYRSGKSYPGGRAGTMFGIGTYTAYGKHRDPRHGDRDSFAFAKQFIGGHYNPNDRLVISRMTLKADARIVEHGPLKRALAAAVRSGAVPSGTDVGHYAVILGYDAIRKSKGYETAHTASDADNWDDGFIVVVNRSAVRITEKNYVPDAHVRTAPAGAAPPPKTWSQAKHVMNSKTAKHAGSVDYVMRPEP